MDQKLTAVAHAQAIPPYHPGLPISAVAREIGIDASQIVKLASNENPRGMSPAARLALQELSEDYGRYPDPDCYELRAALGKKLSLDPAKFVVGAGTSELLVLIARAFLTDGRNAVVPECAFGVYDTATRSVGARSVIVPAIEYGHDLDGMLSAIDEKTSVVFVASPNNPTGTSLDSKLLERFFDDVPPNVLIVFDEAYREFMEPAKRPQCNQWLARYPNLIVLRTFSKIYGLAGLRVGYGMADMPIVNILQKLRSPFSVSVAAQVAAKAALDDDEFVNSSYEDNAAGLKYMSDGLRKLGIRFVPSSANFILLHVDDAAAVYNKLLRRGLIVRPLASWGLPKSLRVTIGTPTENELFLNALRDVTLELGESLSGAQR